MSDKPQQSDSDTVLKEMAEYDQEQPGDTPSDDVAEHTEPAKQKMRNAPLEPN